MHAIADAGLRVPDDIAMVGFDDIEAASLLRPALSTIVQDRRAFGVAAVAALVDTLTAPAGGGDGVVPAPRIVPTKLVVRASCGASRRPQALSES